MPDKCKALWQTVNSQKQQIKHPAFKQNRKSTCFNRTFWEHLLPCSLKNSLSSVAILVIQVSKNVLYQFINVSVENGRETRRNPLKIIKELRVKIPLHQHRPPFLHKAAPQIPKLSPYIIRRTRVLKIAVSSNFSWTFCPTFWR